MAASGSGSESYREFYRGRRVLVTGGLGFIGSNVARAMAGQRAEVTVIDSLDPGCGGDRANVAEVEGRIRVVVGDIRDPRTIDPLAAAADVIVHCAALTSHTGSMTDPLASIDVNYRGTAVLLEAMRRAGRPIRCVHLGTTTQIGRALAEPVTEDHPEFPLDVYSATKTAAEKLVLVYGRRYGSPTTVLRLANCYGPRAKLSDPRLGFINYFVGLAARDMDIPVYGAGDQRRVATFVDDIVEAIVLSAARTDVAPQVFHAAAARAWSVRQIAEAVVEAFGSGRVVTVEWPADRKAIEVGDVVVSSERIAAALGWRATTELLDGLRRTAEWLRAAART
jgi:UDP-glucose 4-epimerase